MALFEKQYTNKVLLDDTQVITSHIENARTIDGHTEYVIKSQRGPLSENSWRVSRRYNDFVQLHSVLSSSGLNLPLPPKKLIGNMEPDFINQRQLALQNYLNIVLMNPILASSLPVRKFLDPENYTAPLHEIALQQVSLALRSDANYEVGKAIPDMGWRLRKHYYTVKNRQNPKQELLLTWVDFGPDRYLSFKDIQGVFKCFGNLKHPYIEPIVHQHVSENGALIIHDFHPDGTLRDVLCNTKPKQSFLKKYGNPKQPKSLTTTEIAEYGYQILVALNFLHEKGIPYGHLHTGNILLTSSGAKILDIKNGLMGLPAFYRPYVVQRRKLHATTQVDVYSFGHVLYEMAFGKPLLEAMLANSELPPCDSKLKNILDIILSPEALKQDLPMISQLMDHPFFEIPRINSQMNASFIEKPYFKLNSHLKDALTEAIKKTESRLKDEQRVARHQKRLVRVQELMTSEEEMKRRKHKLKKEQKLAQERSATQFAINETSHLNGKNSERSDSPTSTSTATSIGTLTPPTHGSSKMAKNRQEIRNMPPPPPMPVNSTSLLPPVSNDRSALLESINSFDKMKLRRIANGNH